MKKKHVLLASSSPQRADVMRELGIDFRAVSMDVDEVVLSSPEETARANARLKALAAHLKFPEEIIVAADTVIEHAGMVLGKPKDARNAEAVLSSMSGDAVRAVTAVAVVNAGAQYGCVATEASVAHLKEMALDDIAWYIGTGEPLTRAGSLGISRYGEIFIERMEGSYSCFAGLPKRALLAAIANVGLAGEILPYELPSNSGVLAEGVMIGNLEMS